MSTSDAMGARYSEVEADVGVPASPTIRSFVCYLLSETLAGSEISDFDDVVDLEGWAGQLPISLETSIERGVDAKLFVTVGSMHEPNWAGFMRSGFGENVSIPKSASMGALLLVRILKGSKRRYFAFTFGSGRWLLRSDCYERRFGLRLALNAIFEGDTSTQIVDSTRIRAIDAKRVSTNTVRSKHQSTRAADLEAFEVDRDRDFLRGVTGLPSNSDVWGTALTGADSLSMNRTTSFAEIPELCRLMLETTNAVTYKQRFGWIDDIAPVLDKATLSRLEGELIERIRAQSLVDIELAVPEIVEWSEIKGFVLPYGGRGRQKIVHPDLRIEDYVRAIKSKASLEQLDIDNLRSQRIDAVDNANERSHRWSTWRCLTAEIAVDGRTYILDDGEFYEVSTDYASTLDNDILRLVPASDISLPQANARLPEERYNANVAAGEFLLLDRKTVKISTSTSPIEICDLLTTNLQFVHVKRKLGSSVLSHLFAQGFVSADLLQNSAEFRTQAKRKIDEALSRRASDAAELDFAKFDFEQDPVRPETVEIVYAIIGEWKGRPFVERLPFFSKVNLRRHAQELRNRGFRVTHACVSETRALVGK